MLEDTEKLFDKLDANGNIHLGLSPLFFLVSAILIQENVSIPLSYDQFKGVFRKRLNYFCEVEGIVSLRWFKNYFLSKGSTNNPNQLVLILEEIYKTIKRGDSRVGGSTFKLPDILAETFARSRNTARYSNVFEAKRKKF